MKKYFSLILLLCSLLLSAQTRHGTKSKFKSYKGLVMAGYQGWFSAPKDGGRNNWHHYALKGKFEPGFASIDMWPSMDEYKKTYKTTFKYPDGTNAHTFSSYDKSTVDLHFKWMKDYHLDGVWVQRFISSLRSKTNLKQNDTVLKHAISSAKKHNRAIGLMYDLSGYKPQLLDFIKSDWKKLVDEFKLTNRKGNKQYIFHNEKPLIAIWGIGFADRSGYNLDDIQNLIDFFKNDPKYGGCSIMLGVPTNWRTLNGDTKPNPQLHKIIKQVDLIMPWFVGRFGPDDYLKFAKNKLPEDFAWCKENKIDYVPLVFPGFSWHNMYSDFKMNHIPRLEGDFLWMQIHNSINSGAEMLYVAMFDEIDEATAIFKLANKVPTGKTNFLPRSNKIPDDYYLQLVGKASKVLKNKAELTEKKPAPKKYKNR